jgi:hypothetical protein
MISFVEQSRQLDKLIRAMETLATHRVDRRVAEGHRRQYRLLQVQVLQMLEVNQTLESGN